MRRARSFEKKIVAPSNVSNYYHSIIVVDEFKRRSGYVGVGQEEGWGVNCGRRGEEG